MFIFIFQKESAPLVTELISLAKQLEPHNKETPTVTVQAEQHKVQFICQFFRNNSNYQLDNFEP